MKLSFYTNGLRLLLSLFIVCCLSVSCASSGHEVNTSDDVQILIIGGGASGVGAGVHAARLGVNTVIL